MTKSDYIAKVAEVSGVSKAEAEKVTNAALSVISDALASGESIQFTGFGTFEVRSREAREGRNPATGQTIQIAACKVPAFKAGSKLKEAVNK